MAEDVAAVALAGVWFRYPDGTEAVRGVDLEVEAGEMVSRVGDKEAGKTTLLRLIAGGCGPSEGDVSGPGPVGWSVPAVDVGVPSAAAAGTCSFGRVTPLCDWHGVVLVDSVADPTAIAAVVDEFNGSLIEARQRGA